MSGEEKVIELVEAVKSLMESDSGLRESQKKALNQFINSKEIPSRGIFNLATGVGKTRVMSMLTLAHLQNNPNSQIVVAVPNKDLCDYERTEFQAYRGFQDKERKRLGLSALNIPEQLDIGVFNEDHKDTKNSIIFTTYHSLDNLSKIMDRSKVGLLLLDEAHHAVSDMRRNAVKSFTNAIPYGMTATPCYSPEKNVEDVIGKIIAKVDIVNAIKEADLAEFKNVLMVSDVSVDLSNVSKNNNGDYNEEDYCRAVLQAIRGNSVNSGNEENWKEAHRYIARDVAKAYRDTVDEYIGPWNGKKCLINCRSQEEARIQAEELNELFKPKKVARVHTSDECDSQTIQDFVNGDLPIVCQVGKLTEGFDMPNLDITINYPTASLVREAQGAARCLRLPRLNSKKPQIMPKKMGVVVDVILKHPKANADNPLDSARLNGQVWFGFVVGSSFVQHEEKQLRLEKISEEKILNTEHNNVSKAERINFTIFSKTIELMSLTREANELEEKRKQEEEELKQGYTSGDVARLLGIGLNAAGYLIKSYEGRTVKNPETGEEEPCTKEMKNASGKSCRGFTEAGLKLAKQEWEEAHKGYTSGDVAKVLGVSQQTATLLIELYKDRTVKNLKTGEEEPCTKMVKPALGKACWGLTEVGLNLVKQEREEAHNGYTPSDVVKLLDIGLNAAIYLIECYKSRTVKNPETGEEEPCTKKIKTVKGQTCRGLTEIGFNLAKQEWEEAHKGYTSADVASLLDISQSAAIDLIKSYEGRTIKNPETGEDKPCIKRMKNTTGKACLGFTEVGLKLVIQEQEKYKGKGYTSTDVTKLLDVSQKTAIDLIKSYEGRTIKNPETGKEEPCTKEMKNASGKSCRGFTEAGLKLAIQEWEEAYKGYTSGDVAKKLGIGPNTAVRLMKRYEGRRIKNPETGEEEPCTKEIKNASGKSCRGFTEAGLKLAIQEWEEKTESKSKAPSALLSRLENISDKVKPNLPIIRKTPNPEK